MKTINEKIKALAESTKAHQEAINQNAVALMAALEAAFPEFNGMPKALDTQYLHEHGDAYIHIQGLGVEVPPVTMQ